MLAARPRAFLAAATLQPQQRLSPVMHTSHAPPRCSSLRRPAAHPPTPSPRMRLAPELQGQYSSASWATAAC
jgi:hypothetical protein